MMFSIGNYELSLLHSMSGLPLTEHDRHGILIYFAPSRPIKPENVLFILVLPRIQAALGVLDVSIGFSKYSRRKHSSVAEPAKVLLPFVAHRDYQLEIEYTSWKEAKQHLR